MVRYGHGRTDCRSGGGPHRLVGADAALPRGHGPRRPGADAGRLSRLRARRAEPAAMRCESSGCAFDLDIGRARLRGAPAPGARAASAVDGWLAAAPTSIPGSTGSSASTSACSPPNLTTTDPTERKRTAWRRRSDYDVKDLALAPEGVRRIQWADRQMPVLAAIRERFERRAAARRLPHLRLPARDDRDREPDADAEGGRRRRRALRVESALDPGRRAAALVAEFDISVFAIKGEDNDTYYQHIEAAVDHKPQLTMDDGADVIGVLHTRPPRAARRHHRRHGGDDHRRDPAEGDGGRRRARVPGDRGQRRADEALLRQPLRHRPVDDRRDHPRDERPARRQALRRRRLRLGRPRRRDAGARAWART